MTAPDDLAATVLITVDSLRADAMPDPGERDSGLQNLAALAEAGTVFENGFANGNWTPFSFPSLLGADHVFAEGRDIGLSERPALAELLRDAGVHTGGFNAANGFLTPYWGYDRGFESFRTYTAGADDNVVSRYLTAHPTVQAWLQFAAAPLRRAVDRVRGDDRSRGLNTSRMADLEADAVSFIESAEEPFFLWIHYMDAHTPYVPAPRYVETEAGDGIGALRMLGSHLRTGLGLDVDERTLRDLRALYRAAVRQVDDSIGRVLEALSRRGIREETCVVFAGDHGEEFQEHGHLAHYPKLYEELVHVPYVVDHPRGGPQTVTGAVGLDSVPPTIAEAMGVASASSLRGESLLETVVAGERPPDEPVCSVAVRGESVTQQPIPRSLDDGELLVSARSRDLSYVHFTDSGRRELYDRRTDPSEQRNVWCEAPGAEAERLVEAAAAYVADLGAAGEGSADRRGGDGAADDPPGAVSSRLRALGYQ